MTIRQIVHDCIDAKGKEEGGVFVFDDVTAAVMPGEVVDISADIASSLGYVDDGHGHQLAVVHLSDLIPLLKRHSKMASVLVVSNDAPVQRVYGGVGGVAGAVQAAESGSSPVLPPDCFVVPSKNGSVCGKKMKDINIAGISVEINRRGDRVIRFHKNDDKVIDCARHAGCSWEV